MTLESRYPASFNQLQSAGNTDDRVLTRSIRVDPPIPLLFPLCLSGCSPLVFAIVIRLPRVSVFPVHPETRGRAFSFHSLSPFCACLRLSISNAAAERVVCRFRAIRKRGMSEAKGSTCTIAVPVCGLVVSRGFRSAVACRERSRAEIGWCCAISSPFFSLFHCLPFTFLRAYLQRGAWGCLSRASSSRGSS